jgi:hypothetical protein
MIRAILVALETGEDQAIAASRGEGKSSVAEWVLMFVLLKGLDPFAVLFAATGPTPRIRSTRSKIGSKRTSAWPRTIPRSAFRSARWKAARSGRARSS